MSQQLTEVGVGLSLDDAVQIIYGSGNPGFTASTDNAQVGSSYSDITTGAKWQKITSGAGQSGWIELAGKDAAIMVQHIASTGVILDQLPTQLATEFAWMVTAYNEADPSNKYSAIVHMSHNGTATADATNVNYDQSSILRQGAKISGLQITGTLIGAGANQYMNLHVSSNTMVTFIAYRMVKNVAGSNTVILGGANLDNHVADGSVHLTAWQNTLLDGVSQSLSSTHVNQLVGVTSPIQAQLNSKVSAASLAAVATSGAYADLTGIPDAGVSSVAGKTGAVTLNAADIASWGSAPYDMCFSVFGVPVENEVVFRFRVGRGITIPVNFQGALVNASTAATAISVFSIKKNGTQFATVSFAASGVVGTLSSQGAVSFIPGDVITVVAPSVADVTLADIDFTILATLS